MLDIIQLIMTNEEMIARMKEYAMKIMPREIGWGKTMNWLNNYKFPESNMELTKLSNIWDGIIWNALIDIDKPTKEELEKEDLTRTIPGILRNEAFSKYYKKVGPSNIIKWLNNYKFPNTYEELVKTMKNWKNIIQELDNTIKISKHSLYKDLAEYYKNSSKIQYYKYRILEMLFR